MEIILKGEPRSTNNTYATVCRGNFPTRYMTVGGKTLKEDYGWQAKSQFKGKLLEGDLEIWIKLYFGNKRKNDWDNFHKISMDALSSTVWVDDSQIKKAHVEKYYDKLNPRIEIKIEEL